MNNFERVYLQSTEIEKSMGFNWYLDQHNYLRSMANHFNVKLKIVCGIVAVTSPMVSWNENLNMAYSILKYKGRVPSNVKMPGFKTNVKKAISIYRTKKIFPYLSGPKVTQFYENLLHPMSDTSITIDTFMIGCYYETDRDGIKKFTSEKHIDFLKNELREISIKYNLLPLQMQATIWLTYHRMVKSMQSYSSQLMLKVF